jgi:hypothetical protein
MNILRKVGQVVNIPFVFVKNIVGFFVAILLRNEKILHCYNVFHAWFDRNRDLFALFGFVFFLYVWMYRIERLIIIIFVDKVFAEAFFSVKNFVSNLVAKNSAVEGSPVVGMNNVTPSFDDSIVYEPGGGVLSFLFDDTVFCFSVLYWIVLFVVVAYHAYFKGAPDAGSSGTSSSSADNAVHTKSDFGVSPDTANPMLTNNNTPMLTNNNNPMLTNNNTPMLTNNNTPLTNNNTPLTNNNTPLTNNNTPLTNNNNPMLTNNNTPLTNNNAPLTNNNALTSDDNEEEDPYSDMPALYDPDYEPQIDTSHNIIRVHYIFSRNVMSRVYPTGSDPYKFRLRDSNPITSATDKSLTRMACISNDNSAEPVYTYVIPITERLEKLEAARAFHSFRNAIPAIEPNHISHIDHKLRNFHDEVYLHDLRVLQFTGRDFAWPEFLSRVGKKVFFNSTDGYEIIVPTCTKKVMTCSDGVDRPFAFESLLEAQEDCVGPVIIEPVMPGYDEVILSGSYGRVLANVGVGNYHVGGPIFDNYQWEFQNERGGVQESRVYITREYTDAKLDPLRDKSDPFFTKSRDKADEFFLSLPEQPDKSSGSGGMKEDADNLFFEILEKITNF